MTNQKTEISGPLTRTFTAGSIICSQGERESDLFFIHSGKLLVFVNNGTQITPIAHLESGTYLGELSFFDGKARSAHVASLEETTLIQIPVNELEKQCPDWLITVSKAITLRIRSLDDLVAHHGLRKKNTHTLDALTIDEQRTLYQALLDYQKGQK